MNFQKLQQQELDGAALYQEIARFTRDKKEGETLLAISHDEYGHAATFAKYSGKTLAPNRLFVFWYSILVRILGYTFIIKLLERREDAGIVVYREEIGRIPELPAILAEEEAHEQTLLEFLDEERLHYVGDIILGMNDALVELTGALAGYTLAMQNTRIIAMAGLITGVSATLSMAGSGYLASREEEGKNAVKSSLTIGLAYLITVVLLIIPYLIFPTGGYLWALVTTMLIAIAIIAAFNFYVAVAKGRSFRKSFWVMVGISVGVAAISFAVGLLVKNVLGINL